MHADYIRVKDLQKELFHGSTSVSTIRHLEKDFPTIRGRLFCIVIGDIRLFGSLPAFIIPAADKMGIDVLEVVWNRHILLD
jgi:hypothetical protein